MYLAQRLRLLVADRHFSIWDENGQRDESTASVRPRVGVREHLRRKGISTSKQLRYILYDTVGTYMHAYGQEDRFNARCSRKYKKTKL